MKAYLFEKPYTCVLGNLAWMSVMAEGTLLVDALPENARKGFKVSTVRQASESGGSPLNGAGGLLTHHFMKDTAIVEEDEQPGCRSDKDK
ncbi:hypothetical protein PM082_013541 [Marasmius tenuissimus]|nr:hypothetical protein PM082_013541 [Marasmius tenuissimus]